MLSRYQLTEHAAGYRRYLTIRSFAIFCFLGLVLAGTAMAQSPSPTPEDPEVLWGGYRVTSASEIGYRWVDVSGNENQYRSTLNYDQGFRLFDTNLLMETESGKGKYFDSLLFTNSGWGKDPSGYTRVRMEKAGAYRFTSNIRQVNNFNYVGNHALGQHSFDTSHNFGDFDLTIFPERERLRFNFGLSYSNDHGPGLYTTRAYSDEFAINSVTDAQAMDYRFGAEGKLAGFNWGLQQGFRVFDDNTSYGLEAPSIGNNTTNTSRLTSFFRDMPVEGGTAYTQFNAQRTFARKFDLSMRAIYSTTSSEMTLNETQTGRDNNNNIILLDEFHGSGEAKRIQFRGDVGFTWLIGEKFRLSDTFTFDRFGISGDEDFFNTIYRTTATGGTTSPPIPYTASVGYRLTNYQRYVNTVEGDYQFSRRLGVHLGYRYAHRSIDEAGIDFTLTSPPAMGNPLIRRDDESNNTHAIIAGMKVMPTKNWTIFWDIEHGSADNVFSRLENSDYTNFRVRSQFSWDELTFNFSAISKDNVNPASTITVPSGAEFTTDVESRYYSGTAEWNPNRNWTFSGGYTFRDTHSFTPIIVPVASMLRPGFSEYFSKDHFGYFDIAARPFERVSFYASYRINWDKGQGDLFSLNPQEIITSYPMQFTSPEFRVAIRLTRNIDWNLGYQYYDYNDAQTYSQNYKAHLPFTSLRIYFGGRERGRYER